MMLQKQFGEWVVLGPAKPKYLSCRCSCGIIRSVAKASLCSGRSKSCGHAHITNRPKGYGGFKRYFRRIKHGAEYRSLEWSLTEIQFMNIVTKPCWYCGQLPENKGITPAAGYTEAAILHAQFVGSGVDRLDNARGYTQDNCVPCCKRCNIAKSTMTVAEFLEWGSRLTLRLHELRTSV